MKTEELKTIAHAINCTTGEHYDLARYCEAKGLTVQACPEEAGVSLIAHPHKPGRFIGEIYTLENQPTPDLPPTNRESIISIDTDELDD